MLLTGLMLLAFSGVAHAEVPLRADEAKPALVDMGGWQIFAADMAVDGLSMSFEDVQARAQGAKMWALSAERLDVLRTPAGDIEWMWARGDVRVLGPDDLYVTAEQAVTMQTRRSLALVGAGELPTAGGPRWRLAAGRIRLQLASGRVEFDGLMAENAESVSSGEVKDGMTKQAR